MGEKWASNRILWDMRRLYLESFDLGRCMSYSKAPWSEGMGCTSNPLFERGAKAMKVSRVYFILLFFSTVYPCVNFSR